MNTLETISKRSSIRGYENRKLTGEELEVVLQAGLMAPTATNRQELHFTVVGGDEQCLKELDDEKNALRGLSGLEHNFYYEAPTLILISGETDFRWSEVDAGIAVENMSLAATELGLGSLIIGCIYDAMHGEKKAYFEKMFRIPEGYDFKIALAIGHRAVEKEQHTFEPEKQITFL